MCADTRAPAKLTATCFALGSALGETTKKSAQCKNSTTTVQIQPVVVWHALWPGVLRTCRSKTTTRCFQKRVMPTTTSSFCHKKSLQATVKSKCSTVHHQSAEIESLAVFAERAVGSVFSGGSEETRRKAIQMICKPVPAGPLGRSRGARLDVVRCTIQRLCVCFSICLARRPPLLQLLFFSEPCAS